MSGLSVISPHNEESLRKTLHVPPRTKAHLHMWVKIFLGIDLPDCIVCVDDKENPPTNSSPLSMLWELYSAALDGSDPNRTFYLYYSCRDGYKSLLASIMEALCLFVLRLDVGHLAAQKQQATNVTRYLKNYLMRPILREFVTSKNEMTIEVTRYQDANGGFFSPVQYEALLEKEKGGYSVSSNYVQIVVATMSGTNSLHTGVLVCDELDLAPPQPIQEAQMSVSQGKGETANRLPLIMMTSTRKFAFGLVQKAIDEAGDTGLIVRKWNLIDITQKCPPPRHCPDEPKIPIYRSSALLSAISEEKWQDLPSEMREKYRKDEGYAGCLKNCKMFASCRGWLATKQTSDSPLLKGLNYTQGLLRRVDVERAKSQLLCWKPSTEGIIYPHLERTVHMLTPAQMAERLTGEPCNPALTKAALMELLATREVRWYAGIDWGYTHNFACVVGAKDGDRMFVVDAIAQPELEIGQRLQLCETRLKPYDPVIFPDQSYPSDNKTFIKHGYRMRKWNKGPGSVAGGIEVVRFKLSPVSGEPQLYFLAEDPGIEVLFTQLQHYHFVADAAGRVTDVPNDEDDDLCDALRYMVMNVFAPKGTIKIDKAPQPQESKLAPQIDGSQYNQQEWARRVIQEQMGDKLEEVLDGEGVDGGNIKRGGFFMGI